jgi:hydrogenase nickel incorporation protein HypA/HybF
MHEMGIALEIIKIVQASIPPDQADARVQRINLKVGKLSAVVPDSLQFCFQVAIQETPLAGAELIIAEMPVTARCRQCQHQWTLVQPVFVCPGCNSGQIEMLSGRELDIVSIEIEDTEDADPR